MKKLATIVVALGSLAIASPAFACPGMDHEEGGETAAPRTADKAKEAPKTTDQAKAKDQPKKASDAKTTKPADKAKPADKVSQR